MTLIASSSLEAQSPFVSSSGSLSPLTLVNVWRRDIVPAKTSLTDVALDRVRGGVTVGVGAGVDIGGRSCVRDGGEFEYAGGGPTGSDGAERVEDALDFWARITGGRGCPGGTATELLRPSCTGRLSSIPAGTMTDCFSVDPRFSKSSAWMSERAVIGRLTSSRRAFSFSRLISTSIRHSTILRTSSNA